MSMRSEEMLNKICPFIKDKCMGDECVNWKFKNEAIEAGASVWGEGKTILQGRAVCRLWVDREEYYL